MKNLVKSSGKYGNVSVNIYGKRYIYMVKRSNKVFKVSFRYKKLKYKFEITRIILALEKNIFLKTIKGP